jgi:metal-responsive CopG/Arc/MetJ family transcriptional regulator
MFGLCPAPLRVGTNPATLCGMTIEVNLPEELVARIDELAEDRGEFVVRAVTKMLRENDRGGDDQELARINSVAEELNREAEDVLEYQVIA